MLNIFTVLCGIQAFATNNFIENGDFEQGKVGYMFADDATTNIKIYDNADTNRPGANEVVLDGKAAYIEGYGAGKYVSKKNNLQYKIVDLPAGEYTFSIDVLANVLDNTKNPMQFGITDAVNEPGTDYERAFGKNLINIESGTGVNTVYKDYEPSITENGAKVNLVVSHLYHQVSTNGLTNGWHNYKLKINFKIDF